MSNDKQLKQSVLDELSWEPSINSAHIGVATKDGVVTLMGHVGTYAEKQAAEKSHLARQGREGRRRRDRGETAVQRKAR